MQAGEPGKRLFKLIEQKGVIPIAWGENGFRELTNSKRPIRRPEDLQGLKVRVVGIPIFAETLRALGAHPVNMDWNTEALPRSGKARWTGKRIRSGSSSRTESGKYIGTSPCGTTPSTR